MDRISGRSLAARLFGASPARTLALLEPAWPLAVAPELARRAAARRSGGDARGGFQGGSSLHSESGVDSPPEIKDVGGTIADPEIRQRFVETMARYLERSKGRNHA